MFVFDVLAQSIGLVYVCVYMFMFSKSSSLFIEEFKRRWEFSRYINVSCFEALILHPWSFAWFDSCPMKNLIQIHSRTEGTTSAAMLLLSLSCCNDKDCRQGGCRVRGRTLRTLSFVNSGEVASGEICFWWRVFRSSSSDSFLQTQFFKRSSSDSFFQML